MDDRPVMLVNNRCPFCCKMMQFIFKGGGYDMFNFISIHSDESKKLLSKFASSVNEVNLMVLVEQEKIFFDTGAILQSIKQLNEFIPVFYWYTVLPGSSADALNNQATEYFFKNE
jgi:predicted DCC family thiol-disulfide oxidoreductase YuxK